MENPCLWGGSIIISLVVVNIQTDTNCGVDRCIKTTEVEVNRYKLGPYRASNVSFLSSKSESTVLNPLDKHAIAETVGKHVFALTAAASKFQSIDHNIFNYGFMGVSRAKHTCQ